VAAHEFMDFDEWQQVFIASAPRWQDLTYELRAEAHPPLFYLLLKGLLALGHGQLLYRTIALLPGAGSVILTGLIARKALRSSALALVCAGTLALSTAAITISIEVRQYQLAVFLILVAFNSYLCFWSERESGQVRHSAIFAISSTLAVCCHYSAILFLGACLLLAISQYHPALDRHNPSLTSLSATFALPLLTFAYFYFTHARHQRPQGYLADFYWGYTPQEGLTTFLFRNFQNFWNLFAPLEIHLLPLFVPILILFCAGSTVIFFRNRRSNIRSIVVVLLPVAMVFELVGLSIARRYPFGGLLRHQYVTGPSLILAFFVVIDCTAAQLSKRAQLALLTLVSVFSVGNLAVSWSKLMVYPDTVMLTDEFNHYRAAFPDAQAVYAEHWGIIAYFIHTNDRRRHFVRRVSDVAWVDQYHMEGPRAGVEIFYDKTRYILNLSDSTLYGTFVQCLKQSHIKQLTLFFLTPGNEPIPQPHELRQIIIQNAARHGLAVTNVIVGRTTVFAGFELIR
jgi:hypothetical protein